MEFNFNKRPAQFGTFNNRNEFEGKATRKKAIDLPVTHSVSPDELDMLIPVQGIPASEFFFGTSKKPQLQVNVLFPFKVHREPEDATIVIYDMAGNPMEFDHVKVKELILSVDLKGAMLLKYKVQFRPGRLLQRISDNVEEKAMAFEIESAQVDLVSAADAAKKAAAPPAGKAGKPAGKAATVKVVPKKKAAKKAAPKAKGPRAPASTSADDPPPIDHERDGFNDNDDDEDD